MTRTTKWTVHEAASTPKWFTHHGHANTDPTKIKKLGAGRGNWGRPGDELTDDEMGTMFGKSQRRNSNHSQVEQDMKDLNDSLEHQLE